eukprot:TRINITY_DN2363_c0_g2_i2.p1 TRINITY_DN2363_c0_g2~~TRINITY_DN2363_c0_g2_i2.p1  ORF type:complete len:532 (-),score=86.37 TRINITY_DN2363_c0_g2_i2:10-1494(-)
MICRSQLTLLEWLGTTGPRTSTMLLSCLTCVAVPGEATMVASIFSCLAAAWTSMPDKVDDSGMFECLLNANIFAGFLWSLALGRPACEGLAMCRPACQSLVLIAVGFITLARLNRDFLDFRCSSCTAIVLRIWDATLARCGGVGRAVAQMPDDLLEVLLTLSPRPVFAAGLLGPIFLVAGETRIGLMLVWATAMFFGFSEAFDFAVILVSSLVFWVPPRHLLELRWMTLSPLARFLTAVLAIALLLPTLLQRSAAIQQRLQRLSLLWTLSLCPFWYALPTKAPSCVVESVIAVSFVQMVALVSVAFALVNGFCPYLGLRTQATWSLLSNLRVEGAGSNHFFMPAWLQLCDYTRECVVVTKTNVPILQRPLMRMSAAPRLRLFRGFLERNRVNVDVHVNALHCGPFEDSSGEVVMPYVLPVLQLRRILTLHAIPHLEEFYVDYLHCSAPHRFEVRNGMLLRGSDPRLARPSSWLVRKLLAFRAFPTSDRAALCLL